ncbi:MAG: hypothetical protein JNL90_06900 [Planctomycetes bacterium]|nr:hypothetical protein [Planctomycetota bacterium]
MTAALLRSFAPGRLALFGHGHEPLRLATLSAAIERGVTVEFTPRAEGGLALGSGAPEAAPRLLAALPAILAPLDLAAALAALHGALRIDDALPETWEAGATAALAVALLDVVLAALRSDPELAATAARWREPRRLGELAGALLAASGEPAATEAALASALHGTHHFQPGATPFVQPLPTPSGTLLVIEPPDAAARLAIVRSQRERVARDGEQLRAAVPDLELAPLAFDAAWNLLLDHPEPATAGAAALPAATVGTATRDERLLAALQQRDLLLAAGRVLASAPFDAAHFGELLERDAAAQREATRLTGPPAALRAALERAGALGIGEHGGAWLAYGRSDDAARLVEAARAVGGAATAVTLSASPRRG